VDNSKTWPFNLLGESMSLPLHPLDVPFHARTMCCWKWLSPSIAWSPENARGWPLKLYSVATSYISICWDQCSSQAVQPRPRGPPAWVVLPDWWACH
jgi:hypothetical protein